MPKDTRELYRKYTKLVSSRLYTEASADLEEKVEEEKKVEDPSAEDAQAAIDSATIKGDSEQ